MVKQVTSARRFCSMYHLLFVHARLVSLLAVPALLYDGITHENGDAC